MDASYPQRVRELRCCNQTQLSPQPIWDAVGPPFTTGQLAFLRRVVQRGGAAR